MLDKLKQTFLYGKDFCEDTAENLRETVDNAVDNAKLRYRITNQRNELNALYADLGRILYKNVAEEEGTMDESEVNKLCSRIAAKEELLKGLEDQLRIVCGKVICSDCGRFMADNYTFCPWCGKPMKGEVYSEGDEPDITAEELDDLRELDGI